MNFIGMTEHKIIEKPPFRAALKFWFKLGWISFGGTLGHIAVMHDYLVTEKKWISNSRFFHALNLCMLLPGPEAQQLAIYIGWQLHGKKGGIVAGILFFLPAMFILLGLSIVYVSFGNLPWISAVFHGLKPAVIAIIIIALWKVGKKALHTPLHFIMAALAFSSIFFYNIAMPYIIVGTICAALLMRLVFPSSFRSTEEISDAQLFDEKEYYLNKHAQLSGNSFRAWNTLGQLIIFLLLWLIPFSLLYFFSADFSFWERMIFFFTQTALFTIGGSYTVLPYVAQFAVSKFNWLSKMQMVDGFALAETTPGPLIIVVSFVGFMAGYNHFHSSLMMGTVGLLTTTFYTFLPSFLFIFAGGPIIERTQGSKAISDVLSFVTASVVGVILNLTFFLGKDIIFPDGYSVSDINWLALAWIIASLVLMLRFKMNVIYLILLSILFGWLQFLLKLYFSF